MICLIYKKGDTAECQNCRGMSLMVHTGKMYVKNTRQVKNGSGGQTVRMALDGKRDGRSDLCTQYDS